MTRAATNERVRHGRVATWRHQHAWCVAASLRQLARRPLGTALTIAVMGFVLALPLALYLLLGNVQHLASAIDSAQSVQVFLKPGLPATAADALAAQLRGRDDVSAVVVRTPQQGLAELAAVRGFGDAIQSLSDNPLPYVLLVEPRAGVDRAQVASMVSAWRRQPQVDLVQDNGQWRTRLDALLALGRRATVLLAALLAAAAVLVIGNTVRLDIRGRADEIVVQQLIGASPAFVRRPYLYEGAWYGGAAGALAVGLVLLLEAALAAPVRELVASYAGSVRFAGLNWATLVGGWAVAVLLGWMGALLASARHLRRPQS